MYKRYQYWMKGRIVLNSSELIPVSSESPKASMSSQSSVVSFTHKPNRFTRIFILHEDICASHLARLCEEGLDTMSKNNLRVITSGIRTTW